MRPALLLLTIVAAISIGRADAAAGPLDDSFDRIVAADARVARIGFRINAANQLSCSARAFNHGMVLQALDQFPSAVRPAAARHYGLQRRPAIAAVVERSPAAIVGLQAGDQLLTIADRATPTITGGTRATYATVAATLDLIDSAASDARSIAIRFSRDGVVRDVALPVTLGCAVRVQLVPSADVNAFADDRYATVTTALERFATDDDALALFIGHELAHAYLRHEAFLDKAGPLSAVLGRLALPQSVVLRTEREADRLGMILAATAGYDVSGAPQAWQRLDAAQSDSSLARTHPSTVERMEAASRLARELSADGVGASSRSDIIRPALSPTD